MSLRDALRKFSDSIVDISNLEVTTYTGTLEQAIDVSTGQIKWDEFKPGNGKLVLVAATLIRPNLNTVNFRADSAESADRKPLFDLHIAAVDSARSGRMAVLRMFAGWIPSLDGK